MARKSNHIHVFQCSEGSISCLTVRSGKSGVTVVKHAVQNGHWPIADGSLQRALVDFVEAEKLSEGRVVTILPRHCATVRILELPSHDADEIAGMVELSADDLVPFSADEIVVSSCIVKRLTDEQSQVLAAVAHRDVLDEHLALFLTADLAPERVYLSTACMLAALEYPTAHGDGATMYVHASADSIELMALDNGALEYTRGVEADTSDMDAFSSVIEQVLNGFERERGGGRISGLNFSRGDRATAPVIDSIQGLLSHELKENTMGLRGVKKGVNVLKGLPLYEIGAVLIAQEDSPYAVDLLPDSVKDDRIRVQSQRALIQNIAMAGLTLLLIVSAFGQAVYQRGVYRDTLEARAEELRPIANSVALKRRHLQRLQDQVTRTDTVYEHLGRVTSQAPTSGLTFSQFSYEYDQGITLQGRAVSTAKFGALIDQLRTVGKTVYPQFAAAQEIYRTSKREQDQDVWDYSIGIDFPKDGGPRDE